jgi:hypothetical protein
MDYHARRVARILDIEDMYSPGKVYIREGPECPNTTAKQRSGTHTSRDEGLPYALKEIPLPSGLEVDMHYELGEDVAVLIEVGIYRFMTRHSTSSTPPGCSGWPHLYGHPNKKGVLPPHLVAVVAYPLV